ncbi:MAG TPA: trypsin-like peptidase domain-containing protein [Candidatus Saccharibacteria bacterium]|nr:trypsin-like peptidase domain-containing protein [Candidatus Saccharibacteria bacterium]
MEKSEILEQVDNIQQNNNDAEQKNEKSEVFLDFRKKKIKVPKFKINWKKIKIIFALVILVLVSSGVGSYCTILFLKHNSELLNKVTQINNYDVGYNTNIVNIVSDVSKSVVNITTQKTTYGWFGQRGVSQGAGTGIIISSDGYILTNNHVIEDSDSVKVTIHSGHEYDAILIKTDSNKDLAVIKVQADSLKPVKIGDSDKIKVGEEVIAIGNVLGRFSDSVTKGIISGLGRPIFTNSSQFYGNVEQLEDLIQTDAAINSGNSGGPLVNAKGEVIGINTAIIGDAQNIGFSVPINHAKELVDNIEK